MKQVIPLSSEHAQILTELVNSNGYSGFMQSWEWGEFKIKEGQKVIRLGLFENEKLIAACSLYYVQSSLGNSILECPHGPVIFWDHAEAAVNFNLLKTEIEQIARQIDVFIVRISPLIQTDQKNFLTEFTRAPMDLVPATTSIVSLTGDLLVKMKEKGRYNLKKGLKNGIIVTSGTEDELIEKLKSLVTKPDAGGYKGGEDIKLVSDDKIKEALSRMTAANPAYKVIAFQPTVRGKSYVILKSKRDIKPEEEATTSARYANPAGKQKELGVGGTHPVVKQGELDVKNKVNIFRKELANAMQNGYGNSLKQAGTEIFKALDKLEQNPFVQADKKAQYKALKMQIRNLLNDFAKQHGEEALSKIRPAPTGEKMMASPTPPPGTPMKAPHSANQPNPFALAHEWAEITGLDLND